MFLNFTKILDIIVIYYQQEHMSKHIVNNGKLLKQIYLYDFIGDLVILQIN